MSLNGQLVFVVLIAIFALAQGVATCPGCASGKFDCSTIYPKCGPNVDHLCFSNGVYYCAIQNPCPDCSLPGFTCKNKYPFCNRETTVSLCYQADQTLVCVEKILPTTTVAPTTIAPTTTASTTTAPTTTAPTTTAPTTTAPTTVAPTTVAPTTVALTIVPAPTTVKPLPSCLTAGIVSGCFQKCPDHWVPFTLNCDVGTCCTFIP